MTPCKGKSNDYHLLLPLQGATVPTYANPGCRSACPGLRTIIGLSARTNWVLTHPHKTSNNMTLEYHFCWIDKPVRHQHVCRSETCKAHGWQWLHGTSWKWCLASYCNFRRVNTIPDFVNASPKLGFVSQNIKKWLDSNHNKIIR